MCQCVCVIKAGGSCVCVCVCVCLHVCEVVVCVLNTGSNQIHATLP